MRNIQLDKILFIPLLALVFLFTQPTHVLSQQNQLSIFPSTVELNPGESYQLEISNTSNQSMRITVTPNLFATALAGDNSSSLVPLENPEQKSYISDWEEHLIIDTDQLEIAPNSSKFVDIEYIKPVPDYLLGVLIAEIPNSESTISVGLRLASVVLDFSEVETDPTSIAHTIKPTHSFNFLGQEVSLTLAGKLKLESNLKNVANYPVQIAGDIKIQQQGIHLQTISLTPQLPATMLPEEVHTTTSTYINDKPLWQQSQKLHLLQTISVGEAEIINENKVLVVAIELVALCLATIAICISLVILLLRQLSRANK